jgi:Cu+-exporting ATPase
MTVTVRSPQVVDYQGKPVYFCSARCKAKFAADPTHYAAPPSDVAARRTAMPAAAAGIEYTCPMHPEVRQDHQGLSPVARPKVNIRTR